jgi:hypothetical protein
MKATEANALGELATDERLKADVARTLDQRAAVHQLVYPRLTITKQKLSKYFKSKRIVKKKITVRKSPKKAIDSLKSNF